MKTKTMPLFKSLLTTASIAYTLGVGISAAQDTNGPKALIYHYPSEGLVQVSASNCAPDSVWVPYAAKNSVDGQFLWQMGNPRVANSHGQVTSHFYTYDLDAMAQSHFFRWENFNSLMAPPESSINITNGQRISGPYNLVVTASHPNLALIEAIVDGTPIGRAEPTNGVASFMIDTQMLPNAEDHDLVIKTSAHIPEVAPQYNTVVTRNQYRFFETDNKVVSLNPPSVAGSGSGNFFFQTSLQVGNWTLELYDSSKPTNILYSASGDITNSLIALNWGFTNNTGDQVQIEATNSLIYDFSVRGTANPNSSGRVRRPISFLQNPVPDATLYVHSPALLSIGLEFMMKGPAADPRRLAAHVASEEMRYIQLSSWAADPLHMWSSDEMPMFPYVFPLVEPSFVDIVYEMINSNRRGGNGMNHVGSFVGIGPSESRSFGYFWNLQFFHPGIFMSDDGIASARGVMYDNNTGKITRAVDPLAWGIDFNLRDIFRNGTSLPWGVPRIEDTTAPGNQMITHNMSLSLRGFILWALSKAPATINYNLPLDWGKINAEIPRSVPLAAKLTSFYTSGLLATAEGFRGWIGMGNDGEEMPNGMVYANHAAAVGYSGMNINGCRLDPCAGRNPPYHPHGVIGLPSRVLGIGYRPTSLNTNQSSVDTIIYHGGITPEQYTNLLNAVQSGHLPSDMKARITMKDSGLK